jgi:hypothetical protein
MCIATQGTQYSTGKKPRLGSNGFHAELTIRTEELSGAERRATPNVQLVRPSRLARFALAPQDEGGGLAHRHDISPHGEVRAERASNREGGMQVTVYILRCADGSYYTGSTREDVKARALPLDDRTDPARRHAERQRQRIDRHTKGHEKLLGEDFAGMRRNAFRSHSVKRSIETQNCREHAR